MRITVSVNSCSFRNTRFDYDIDRYIKEENDKARSSSQYVKSLQYQNSNLDRTGKFCPLGALAL